MSLELRVVLIGDTLESTPEGLFRADRIRHADAARRRELEAILSPFALAELDALDLELERRLLYG